MWTRHKQQQQCGAQLPPDERIRRRGTAPEAATRDRDAQEHDRAGDPAQPGDYPASALDNARSIASAAPVSWDAVVQPEQAEAGLDQADDAEAEAALREQGTGELAEERERREGPERFDRND